MGTFGRPCFAKSKHRLSEKRSFSTVSAPYFMYGAFSSAGEILRTDVRFYSENIRQIAEKLQFAGKCAIIISEKVDDGNRMKRDV